MIKHLFPFFLAITILLLISCGVPKEMRTDHIPPVKSFQIERYLGTWFEAARLPNSFEENLEQVTATYSLKENGEVKVINRGFNTENKEWEEAEGNAWVPDLNNPARLKVSFFWIFSSDYKIIALDQENYSYSMVTSSSKKYLWILTRTKNPEENIVSSLITKADSLGFDISKIIKVKQ